MADSDAANVVSNMQTMLAKTDAKRGPCLLCTFPVQ